MGNRALGKRDKKERRERKLELTWNGKGSYVWKGRRSEGVKDGKEGIEIRNAKERERSWSWKLNGIGNGEGTK